MSAETKNRQASESQATAAPDFCGALFQVLRGTKSKEDLYRHAVRAIAVHFDAPYAILQADSSTGSFEEAVEWNESATAAWKKPSGGFLLSARYENVAKAKLFHAESSNETYAVMAAPVPDGPSRIVGSIAVVTRCHSKEMAEARLTELKALVGTVNAMAAGIMQAPASAAAAPAKGRDVSATGVAKAAQYNTLSEFAFAIANNLKGKLGCDQVALGIAHRGRVRVLCVSGFDNLYPRSPGTRQIQQAMEECYDARQIICCQAKQKWADDDPATGHRLHKVWHEQTGNAPVASIPLMAADECVAVLSVRNPSANPFTKQEITKVHDMVNPLASGLVLLDRANKSLVGHLLDAVGVTTSTCMAAGAWGRKTAAAAALLLGLWMTCGQQDYIVSVPCEIAPAEVRQMVAPFDGTIAEALVEPGDEVRQGQVLLRMDTRQLEIERARLLSELEVALLETTSAVQEKDIAVAAQSQARADIARNKLAAVEYKVSQADIVSPCAGAVLLGDVTPRVGEVVPLGEPLFEFAPHSHWIVELHVPEYAAPYLVPGQLGEFTTNARPDERSDCKLSRLDPASAVVNGKNVFTAEAEVAGLTPKWLRSGMQGVARVNAGKHSVWWVWSHRVIDSIRLTFWKL